MTTPNPSMILDGKTHFYEHVYTYTGSRPISPNKAEPCTVEQEQEQENVHIQEQQELRQVSLPEHRAPQRGPWASASLKKLTIDRLVLSPEPKYNQRLHRQLRTLKDLEVLKTRQVDIPRRADVVNTNDDEDDRLEDINDGQFMNRVQRMLPWWAGEFNRSERSQYPSMTWMVETWPKLN